MLVICFCGTTYHVPDSTALSAIQDDKVRCPYCGTSLAEPNKRDGSSPKEQAFQSLLEAVIDDELEHIFEEHETSS